MTEIKQVHIGLAKFSGGLFFFGQRSNERVSCSFSWSQVIPVVPREIYSCNDPHVNAISAWVGLASSYFLMVAYTNKP